MIRKTVVFGLGAILLAACVPVPAQAPNPPAAPAPEPSEAEMTEGQPLLPVDVRAMTCATLTSASDDDKAYASMFLLGYRSALIHMRTIEIKKIEAVEEAALAQCAANPQALATKIFAQALTKVEHEGEPPIRWTHHKHPAGETPATQAAPPAPGGEQPAPGTEPPAQPAPKAGGEPPAQEPPKPE